MIEPYQRLLELARREHELARSADFEGLERVDGQRRRIVAALPARPPAAAKPLLVEMAKLQAQTTAVLSAARDRLTAEMAAVDRTSETAQAYGRQATQRHATFSAAV